STSRWTPLLLANGWQLQAPIADFHRLATRHAWRTAQKPAYAIRLMQASSMLAAYSAQLSR
ncbi:hypothetical protein, partial [Paenibacillus chungangensis]